MLQKPRFQGFSEVSTVMSIACALISCSFQRMVVTIKARQGRDWKPGDSFWSVTGCPNRIAAGMDIHIDASNNVPIRRQLTEQIMFLIATQRLKDGELLPSVRELARRLKVHHN